MVMALAAHGSPASVESAAVQTEGDGSGPARPSVGELPDSRTECVVAPPPGSTLQDVLHSVKHPEPGNSAIVCTLSCTLTPFSLIPRPRVCLITWE